MKYMICTAHYSHLEECTVIPTKNIVRFFCEKLFNTMQTTCKLSVGKIHSGVGRVSFHVVFHFWLQYLYILI